jgi:hypothetical protein
LVLALDTRRLDSGGPPIRIALDKWYFDCVSPEGDVLIGYAARLKWGPLTLNYGARIIRPNDGPLSQKQSLAFGCVTEAPGTIAWRNDRLSIEGSWTGGDAISATTVVEESSGKIEWQCLSANAAVEVRVDGRTITGTGYAEKLTMTIPPWRLPFTELRWGRYISDDRSEYVVWIDVSGKTRRNWIWVSSGEPAAGTVDDRGVRTDSAELTFEVSRPLREENVASTLFGRAAFLRRLLPRGLRDIQEAKQVSSCVLRRQGSESKGLSVNEVVRWR